MQCCFRVFPQAFDQRERFFCKDRIVDSVRQPCISKALTPATIQSIPDVVLMATIIFQSIENNLSISRANVFLSFRIAYAVPTLKTISPEIQPCRYAARLIQRNPTPTSRKDYCKPIALGHPLLLRQIYAPVSIP